MAYRSPLTCRQPDGVDVLQVDQVPDSVRGMHLGSCVQGCCSVDDGCIAYVWKPATLAVLYSSMDEVAEDGCVVSREMVSPGPGYVPELVKAMPLVKML